MKYLPFSQTKSGSNHLLCAHGRAEQTQLHIFLRRISQSEIRNSAAAEKSESESEGGQKFLPPNPLPFCPPERSVSAALRAAISRDFVQKRFELRSVIATIIDFRFFEARRMARSAPLARRSARQNPYISIFFVCRFAALQSKFLNPALSALKAQWPKATNLQTL